MVIFYLQKIYPPVLPVLQHKHLEAFEDLFFYDVSASKGSSNYNHKYENVKVRHLFCNFEKNFLLDKAEENSNINFDADKGNENNRKRYNNDKDTNNSNNKDKDSINSSKEIGFRNSKISENNNQTNKRSITTHYNSVNHDHVKSSLVSSSNKNNNSNCTSENFNKRSNPQSKRKLSFNSRNEMTVAELVFNFFNFYLFHFDPRNYCIDIQHKYFVYRNANKFESDFEYGKEFVFIDPIDCDYNPGKYMEHKSSQPKILRKELYEALIKICDCKNIIIDDGEEQK